MRNQRQVADKQVSNSVKDKKTNKKATLSQTDREKIKLESLRTKLALKQTQMACERSLLSYIRTACVFVSLAFTYLKVASNDTFDLFVVIMFAIGVAFLIFGIIEYRLVIKRQRILSRHLTDEYISQGVFDEDV